MTLKQARLPAALLALVILAALLWTAFNFYRTPGSVSISGESEFNSQPFRIGHRRYDLSADLLATCQYTLYLTPEGQDWAKAGKAIASVSGETTLSDTTDLLGAGRYFIHSFTNPEEGCSWTLRMKAR